MNNPYVNTLERGTILIGKTYRYEILEVLGQGSFGIAYKAQMYYKIQNDSGQLVEQSCAVAIKEFFMKKFNGREGSSVTEGSSQGIVKYYKSEFEHEAENLRYMVHPHIVKVHELFYANDTVYYSMELLDKRTLDDVIKEKGKLSLPEALKFVQEIGSALSCMHDYKMLHLDLKPSNIMINAEGEAVLIDFGLSKRYSQDNKAETDSEIGKGTPGYAPIEQSNQEGGNNFALTMDIYALGATFFKMLTGQRPPDAITIVSQGFPAYILQEADVDENLMPSIAKSMNPDKSKRFQTVDDFIKACLPEPDFEKADELERLAEAATGKERIELLKAAYAADNTRLSVIKALDGHYIDGDIIEKDLSKSAEWCLKAAKLGDNEAQRDIADMYSCGDGVPQNDYLAVKWYREAAKQGHDVARLFLALKYFDGKGVPQDYAEAYRWFKIGVEKKGAHDATSELFWMGYMHENGLGVTKDYNIALSLYNRVVAQYENKELNILDSLVMIPQCMYRVGMFYRLGLGIDTDYINAIRLLEKAAHANNADALFTLGCMYFDGEGCVPDIKMAIEYWTKSANIGAEYEDGVLSEGTVSSFYNLGVCYESGNGCAINYNLARGWYQKALDNGHEKAASAIENLDKKIIETQKHSGFINRLKRLFS